MNELHLTLKHEGKMQGMQSLSTNTLANPLCIANHQIKGSICEKCYAAPLLKCRKGLKDRCESNTTPLITGIISQEDLPFVNNKYFRFEAFGEIYNETHLINYINIAKKNPHCGFALFTKNYKIIYEYFLKHHLPGNMNIILSSLMVNIPFNITKFTAAGIKVKTFTVYNKAEVERAGIEINCGSRSCITCLQCYTQNETIEIRELLKSDQKRRGE